MSTRRRREEIAELVQSTMPWEPVSEQVLSPKEKAIYRHRKDALDLYIDGKSISEIKHQTHVDGSYLRRMLKRCLKVAPDGMVYGYRALLPNIQTKSYTRTKEVNPAFWVTGAGLSGVLGAIFQRYPDVKEYLEDLILKKKIIKGKDTESPIHEFAIKAKEVHRKFIECLNRRDHPPTEWPYYAKHLGRRSISEFVKSFREQNIERTVQIVGDRAAIAHIAVGTGEVSLTKPTGLLDAVQIDSHTLDAAFSIKITFEDGIDSYFELKSLHVLVAVEVISTAVLWFRIVYGADATTEDILGLIREMLGEERPKPIEEIENLSLKSGAGFPADEIPVLRQAQPTVYHFDNALCHLANKVSYDLRVQTGSIIEFGRPGHFERRAIIENTFKRVTEDLCKRLPSTKGAGPDKGRAKNPGEAAIFYKIESRDLEQLIYTELANLNSEPSSGLRYSTPLEALKSLVEAKHEHFMPWYPPADKKKVIGTIRVKVTCTVVAYLNDGIRPFIRFACARYSSSRLRSATNLIGQKIVIEVNESDIRVVHAFLLNGEPLGPLNVLGAWRKQPHSLRTRKTINALHYRKILKYVEGECPVDAYMRHLAQKDSVRQRAAASELDRLIHEQARLSSSAPPIADDVVEQASSDVPALKAEASPNRDFLVPASTIDLFELVKKL